MALQLPPAPTQLERALDLKDLLGFGIASILGSGGFNMIGEGVYQGGPMFPAAIALVTALFQGASKVYTEAYKAFKSNTAESDVVEAMFGKPASILTGVSIVGFNVFVSSTTLIYAVKNLFPKGALYGHVGFAAVLLSMMTGFALKGIELDKKVIGGFSVIILGLLSFCSFIGVLEGVGTTPMTFPGAIGGVRDFSKAIVFFYFVLSGFDDLMKFVEESRDPDKDIPRSFYLSNLVASVLTLGVGYAFVRALVVRGGGGGSTSGGGVAALPTNNILGTIFGSALGVDVEKPLFFFGILIMLVTSFINFLVVSRYLYGLAEKHEAFGGLKDLNKEKVPWKAVLLTCGLIFGALFVNNTFKLVELSDFFLTCALAAVSGAVTKMRWDKGEKPWVEGATTVGFLGMLYACCWPF